MTFLFNLAGIAFLLSSMVSCAAAKSAIHEINGMLFMIAAVLSFGFGKVISLLQAKTPTKQAAAPDPPPPRFHDEVPPLK